MALNIRSLILDRSAPYGTSGAYIGFFSYVTPDSLASVLASGYFNAARGKLMAGGVIDVLCGAGGTPQAARLVVSSSPATGDVVVAPDVETEGGGGRAVVPTADGLTTGLILSTDRMVVATSANADHILTLPAASAATRGKEILIYVVASTNCELRTPDASGQTINGVDSDGTQEALLAHSHTYRLTQHLADGWIMEKLTNLGAVATAVVPD